MRRHCALRCTALVRPHPVCPVAFVLVCEIIGNCVNKNVINYVRFGAGWLVSGDSGRTVTEYE